MAAEIRGPTSLEPSGILQFHVANQDGYSGKNLLVVGLVRVPLFGVHSIYLMIMSVLYFVDMCCV